MKKTMLVLLAILFSSATVFSADIFAVKVNSDVPINFYLNGPGFGGGGVGNYSYDPTITAEEFVPNADYELTINSVDGQQWKKTIKIASSNDKVTLVTKTGDSLIVSYCQEADCPQSSGGKFNLHLKKGWNMVPFEALSYIGGADCQANVKVAYIYTPSTKKYYGPITPGQQPSQNLPGYEDFVRDYSNNYYQTTTGLRATWLYIDTSCNISVKFNTYLTYANQGSNYPQGMFNLTQDYLNKFKILSGWNFMNVSPWMRSKNIKTIFSKCTVTGFNQWDADSQQWIYPSSSTGVKYLQQEGGTTVHDSDFGKTFIIKTESDCYASLGAASESPSPPPNLPN